MDYSKSSDDKAFKTETKPTQNTQFSAADLTIRDRVLAYKDALDNAKPNDIGRKDALLSHLCREVENLQSQLRNAEQMFGSGDEMVSVLKEALASAQCRKETRIIELADEEEEGSVSGNVAPLHRHRDNQEFKKDDGIDAEWLLLWLAFRRPKNNVYQIASYPHLATKF